MNILDSSFLYKIRKCSLILITPTDVGPPGAFLKNVKKQQKPLSELFIFKPFGDFFVIKMFIYFYSES